MTVPPDRARQGRGIHGATALRDWPRKPRPAPTANILHCARFVVISLERVRQPARSAHWLQKTFFDILLRRRAAPFWACNGRCTALMGLWSFSKIDPDFRGIRPVESERDGHADACHTRPWHSCSAAVGVLRAAGVTAHVATFQQCKCRTTSDGARKGRLFGKLLQVGDDVGYVLVVL